MDEASELKARCDKLEMILALVVERLEMGHQSDDGKNVIFTDLDTTDVSSLHKSRRKGKRYLHLEIGTSRQKKHWTPDDTKSN